MFHVLITLASFQMASDLSVPILHVNKEIPTAKISTSLRGSRLLLQNIEEFGTCYSPFHLQDYPMQNYEVMNPPGFKDSIRKDLDIIRDNGINIIRTYYSSYMGIPITPLIVEKGMKIYLGVYMTDAYWSREQIDSAISAAIQYPGSVEAILVGNENVKPYGRYSVHDIIKIMDEIRGKINNPNIRIGTVQRVTEWLLNDNDIKLLADKSDYIGVNIYPFFDSNFKIENPVDVLNTLWNQLIGKYPIDKLRVTETGYPTSGAPPSIARNSIPSIENAKKYYDAIKQWNIPTRKGPLFWFSFFDLRHDDNTLPEELEKHFGLYTEDRRKKY